MGAEPQEAGVSSNPGPDFVLYDAPSPSGKTEQIAVMGETKGRSRIRTTLERVSRPVWDKIDKTMGITPRVPEPVNIRNTGLSGEQATQLVMAALGGYDNPFRKDNYSPYTPDKWRKAHPEDAITPENEAILEQAIGAQLTRLWNEGAEIATLDDNGAQRLALSIPLIGQENKGKRGRMEIARTVDEEGVITTTISFMSGLYKSATFVSSPADGYTGFWKNGNDGSLILWDLVNASPTKSPRQVGRFSLRGLLAKRS